MGRRQKHSSKPFQTFKAECVRLMEALGLKDWDVVITDSREVNDDDSAETDSNQETRIAIIKWNRKNEGSEFCDPLGTAKHEIGHLLLLDLEALAESRWTTQQQIDLESEKLATILEKVL